MCEPLRSPSEPPPVDGLAQALFAFGLRFCRPPRVLVVSPEATVRREIVRRLSGRAMQAVELADTMALHREVLRTAADPIGRPIDLIVAAPRSGPSVSPLHAIGFAIARRLCPAAVLLAKRVDDEPGVYACPVDGSIEAFERVVLRSFQRLFSRPLTSLPAPPARRP